MMCDAVRCCCVVVVHRCVVLGGVGLCSALCDALWCAFSVMMRVVACCRPLLFEVV